MMKADYFLLGAFIIPILLYAVPRIFTRLSSPRMVSARIAWRYVSDGEFLAACHPGTRPEVALKVRHIVSEQLNIPEHEIHPDDRFIEDLHAD